MQLTFIGEQFRAETKRPFTLHALKKGRKPIEVGPTEYKPEKTVRLNHFMVKVKYSDEIILPEEMDLEIKRFVHECLSMAKCTGLPYNNRYAYLTVDNKPIKAGQTQRTPGWHLDGLQGEEVPVKVPACYEFIWVNKLPFEYTTQDFEIYGLNTHEHNIFDSLGSQVYDDSIEQIKANCLYLMNPYLLHRAVAANEDITDRLFFRLYVSELPITSTKMSINPLIEYPYAIHTTTGSIPNNLSVWEPDENQMIDVN